jgi:flap endonuclease-1
MGVRYLNGFIQRKCVNAISRVHLREFTGKRIAVDTSIYMYRYSGEDALLENIYLMASVFRYYNIHAVFIFDGPPPPQKTELLEKRRKKKDDAKREYDRLEKQLKEQKSASTTVTTTAIEDIEETMRELKKQIVRLRDCDISAVKELLVSFGFATIDAEGEADVLCANLSIKRRVDACLSDDTDMFLYGCPVVLRNLSLLNHTAASYNTQEIMKTLKITQQEFKMMCVVCGTDYSAVATTPTPTTAPQVIYPTLDSVYNELKKYNLLPAKDKEKYHNSGGGFYDWYSERHTNRAVSAITYIANEDMFDTSVGIGMYKQLVVLNRENIHKKRIVEIMTKEDFIFIEPSPSDEDIIKTLSSGKGSLTSSPVYGIEQTTDNHANIIATEVYGINASSFEELHTFHKKKTKYLKNGK